MLRVVEKPTGKTPDGKPAVLEALVNYIKCAVHQQSFFLMLAIHSIVQLGSCPAHFPVSSSLLYVLFHICVSPFTRLQLG